MTAESVGNRSTNQDSCPKCKTATLNAPGIGPYCPNPDCDVIDNILGTGKIAVRSEMKLDVAIELLREASKTMDAWAHYNGDVRWDVATRIDAFLEGKL